jgi:hypothetical protein
MLLSLILYSPFLIHQRGKLAATYASPYLLYVERKWKSVDNQVVVTLPNFRIVILSTNSQP